MGMFIKRIVTSIANAIVAPLLNVWSAVYKSTDMIVTHPDTITADINFGSSGSQAHRGRIAYASGKRYLEIDIPSLSDYQQVFAGLAKSTFDFVSVDPDSLPVTEKYLYSVYQAAGGPHYHGVINGDDYANDIGIAINFPLRICIAVDFDAGQIWMKEASQLFVKRGVGETTTPWDAAALTLQPPSLTFTPGTALYPVFADSSVGNPYNARFVLSDFSVDANLVSNVPVGFAHWYDGITNEEMAKFVQATAWDYQNYAHVVEGGTAAVGFTPNWFGPFTVAEDPDSYGATLQFGDWYLPTDYDIFGTYEMRYVLNKISGVDATIVDGGILDWSSIRRIVLSVNRSGGEGEGTTTSTYEVTVEIRNTTSKAIFATGTFTATMTSTIPGV